MQNLSSNDRKSLNVWSLCALSADELLLACGTAGLRSLSLHTGMLAARDPTALQNVRRVAFDAHTDTLLLLVQPPIANYWQLVSLRRNASEWLEVQRLNISLPLADIYSSIDIEVCDSRVMLGGGVMKTLYVFDVSAAHTLRYAGSEVHQQNAIHRFACTRRDNDTLVATLHSTGVSLQRLASPLRLERMVTSVEVTCWLWVSRLLFRGELLLIFDWKHAPNKDAIVSLRATDNALTERRVLLDDKDFNQVTAWTLAGDQLVISDSHSNLLVYHFVWTQYWRECATEGSNADKWRVELLYSYTEFWLCCIDLNRYLITILITWWSALFIDWTAC